MSKFTKELLEDSLEWFIKLRDYSWEEGDGLFFEGFGICRNVELKMFPAHDFCKELITHYSRSWDKYSGNVIYPVPNPSGGGPAIAYNSCRNLWVGEYGALRYELLDHLIKEVQNDLEKNFVDKGIQSVYSIGN